MLTIMKTISFKVSYFIMKHKTALMFGIILLLMFDSTSALFALDGETAVGQALDNGANHLIKEIEAVYCGSLAFLLLIISAFTFAFTTNDKVKGVTVGCMVATIGAYIAIKILAMSGGGVIGSTMDTVTDWVDG